MELTVKEKIKSVEKKIQLVVMLAVFFPVVIEAIFSFAGTEPKETSGIILQSGMIIFFAVTNYLVFEWQKYKLSSRQLDYLTWILVSTIICFTYVVFFLALATDENNQWIGSISAYLYPFLLGGFAYLPAVSLLIIVMNWLFMISSAETK